MASVEGRCEVEAQAKTTSDLHNRERSRRRGWSSEPAIDTVESPSVSDSGSKGSADLVKGGDVLARTSPDQLDRVKRTEDDLDAGLAQQFGARILRPDERCHVVASSNQPLAYGSADVARRAEEEHSGPRHGGVQAAEARSVVPSGRGAEEMTERWSIGGAKVSEVHRGPTEL